MQISNEYFPTTRFKSRVYICMQYYAYTGNRDINLSGQKFVPKKHTPQTRNIRLNDPEPKVIPCRGPFFAKEPSSAKPKGKAKAKAAAEPPQPPPADPPQPAP